MEKLLKYLDMVTDVRLEKKSGIIRRTSWHWCTWKHHHVGHDMKFENGPSWFY